MLSAKQVQAISQLPGPVLTAYLNTMSAEPSHHPVVPVHLTWLKNEAEVVARSLPTGERARFYEQVRRLGRHFEGRHPQEKSLVIFAGPGTWELLPLQVEVQNELRWGKPGVSQLFWLTQAHRPFEVVVVDRKGARFFRHQLQEWVLLEKKEFAIDISQWKRAELGHVTGQGVHKTRGSQRNVFQDRLKAQYARLCEQVAERAAALRRTDNLAGIFLVGTGELAGMIEAAIPRELHWSVLRIKEDLGKLSDFEVQKALEPLLEEGERQNGTTPVSALFESKNGVILGVDETLMQLQRGRVRAVVLERDLEFRVNRCSKCGRMDRSEKRVCARCGASRRATTLHEVLPELVWTQEVELAIVSGEAGAPLRSVGGMGGWLREAKRAAAH
jgi:hypothetical protein